MSELHSLGEILDVFYNDKFKYPHSEPVYITIKENGETIAKGDAEKLKNTLLNKLDYKIDKWEAWFNSVTLTITNLK